MESSDARIRIAGMRRDLRLALRALSGPKPDWDEALYRLAEVELSISIINEGARLRGDIVATDDERRRAAASLRKIRSGWASGTCYYAIINALGYPDTSREDGGHALYSLLADLIDPDTTTDTTKSAAVSPKSDDTRERLARALGIDLPALLALAEEIASAGYNEWLYSDDFEQDAIARCIREACGEAVA